jgi:cation:H+ antiporter
VSSSSILLLQFAACALIILIGGYALTRFGQAISAATGIGSSWIGLALLASVTSLPELASGVSAVTLAHAPDIAVGDVLGSCVFNLVLLAIVDAVHRPASLYSRAGTSHLLAAGFGVMLLAFVAAMLVLEQLAPQPALFHIGAYMPAIVLGYAVALRTSFGHEREQPVSSQPPVGDVMTLRRALIGYVAAASVVVAAGVWLPNVGVALARSLGWHDSFVGTLFVAAATSLPEAAVSLAALRLGAIDMAVSNLLGSNLFNVLILVVDDLAYTRGPLLAAVAPVHVVSALTALVMTGLVIVALVVRPRSHLLGVMGWVSWLLVVLYLVNAWLLFTHGG